MTQGRLGVVRTSHAGSARSEKAVGRARGETGFTRFVAFQFREDQETRESDEPGEEGWATLEGRMRIGDTGDDERLVVWLLRNVPWYWSDVTIS